MSVKAILDYVLPWRCNPKEAEYERRLQKLRKEQLAAAKALGVPQERLQLKEEERKEMEDGILDWLHPYD